MKLAEEEAALYKRKAIIRQQTDEEQINADLNVLRIKREAVDAEVEVKVADEDAKNVPHDLNIPVDKNRTEQYITEHFGQTKHYDFYAASAQPDENVPFVSNTTIPLQQSLRNDSNLASQLTTFLLKKDLLMTRLTTFDEKPEHYLSWKVNFKGHDIRAECHSIRGDRFTNSLARTRFRKARKDYKILIKFRSDMGCSQNLVTFG